VLLDLPDKKQYNHLSLTGKSAETYETLFMREYNTLRAERKMEVQIITMTMKLNPWKLLEQYPEQILEALAALVRERTASCYITGGTVRDWLMNLHSRDLDITVPHDAFGWAAGLARIVDGTFIPMDEDEDVARVVCQDAAIDFSSFREGTKSIEEDLLKRDFTFNSMAISYPAIIAGLRQTDAPPEIIDPAGGQKDLEHKIIRSNSAAVFVSDPLRLLRAYRFMATFGFSIEPFTKKKIQEHIHLLYLVAEERIAHELDCIMGAPVAIKTIEAMHENGILQELLPELYRGVGVMQPASHHLDVFEHGMATLKHMENVQKEPERYFPGHGETLRKYLADPRKKILLKWAALFHDLGKPQTHNIREDRGGRITFYNHDKEGARIFAIIADRLRWSRDDRNFVSQFISVHMWPFHLNNARRKTGLTPKAYLRLIKAVQEEFHGLFILAMADSLAGRGPGKPPSMEEDMAILYHEFDTVYRLSIKPALSKRLLTGNDLRDVFRLEPGPQFRSIFNSLERAQVEGEVKDREEAINWVKNYLKLHK
jgi:poly(A) polymerase